MIRPGHRIGGYEIVAPLKAGGMATLYVAKRVGPGGFVRPVAIKIVHHHLSEDDQFINMFFDEARLSALIHHPNVVHVEDLGEEDGVYYLAMEFVHGVTLSQFMRQLGRMGRSISPELAVYVAMQIAEGLHAAHETRGADGELLGVVHRDVSPQNVLLAFSGHVKVIDFGVAKARGRFAQTNASSIKGKIRYMAPEQAWGREVDRTADVYSLGIMLWEMLTGRRLYGRGTDLEILSRVRNPAPMPPSRFNPSVSSDLDAVAMCSLAMNRYHRFTTAQAFRRAMANASTQSFAIDSEDLSNLLTAVMKREIVKQLDLIPDEATRVVVDGRLAALDVEQTINLTSLLSLSDHASEWEEPEDPADLLAGEEPDENTDPGFNPTETHLMRSSRLSSLEDFSPPHAMYDPVAAARREVEERAWEAPPPAASEVPASRRLPRSVLFAAVAAIVLAVIVPAGLWVASALRAPAPAPASHALEASPSPAQPIEVPEPAPPVVAPAPAPARPDEPPAEGADGEARPRPVPEAAPVRLPVVMEEVAIPRFE